MVSLILYPGSGAETYKMAYNSTSTIAALTVVTGRLIRANMEFIANDPRRGAD